MSGRPGLVKYGRGRAQRSGAARTGETVQASRTSTGAVGRGVQPGPDVARYARVARAPAAATVNRTAGAAVTIGRAANSPLARSVIAPGGQRLPTGEPTGFRQTLGQSGANLLKLPTRPSWVPGGRTANPFARGMGPGADGARRGSLARASGALNLLGSTPFLR